MKENKETNIELFSKEDEKKLVDQFYVDQLKYHNDVKVADHNLVCFKEELEQLKKMYYKEIADFLTIETNSLIEGGYREV